MPSAPTKKHPLFVEMITAAIQADSSRKGTSKHAIVKYVSANYDLSDVKNLNQIVKMTIIRNIESGKFVQHKGVGASGSFKLPPKQKPVAAKPAVKKVVKKPAAKKTPVKKAAPKKTATPKKSAKKASPKKKTPAKKSKKSKK